MGKHHGKTKMAFDATKRNPVEVGDADTRRKNFDVIPDGTKLYECIYCNMGVPCARLSTGASPGGVLVSESWSADDRALGHEIPLAG